VNGIRLEAVGGVVAVGEDPLHPVAQAGGL